MRKLLILFLLPILSFCNQNTDSKEDNQSIFQNLSLLFMRNNRLTIAGTAVKGIVKNASVAVSPLNADGSCNSSDNLASTVTDDTGNYSLVYKKTGGIVCLTVSANPNGQTTMYDEATKADVPVSAESDFNLVTILPESKITNNSKQNALVSPFSKFVARRLQFLMKDAGSGANTTALYRKASKEVVIRFGLASGLTVASSKSMLSPRAANTDISDDTYPELDDLVLDLQDPTNPLTAKYSLVLAGFSYLAQKYGTGSSQSDNLDAILTAFGSDYADGTFDGKDETGQPIVIGTGTNQVSFSGNPLTTILLPAIKSYIQEGGKLTVGLPNTTAATITVTQITNQTQFVDNATIVSTIDTGISSVATPTFSPVAGHYNTAQNITISTTTSGANVYYTTDGNAPTTSSTLYSTAVHIWFLAGKTVKAIATKSGMTDSAIAALAGVFSYPPLKSGAGAIGGYTLVTGEDGLTQNGAARGYTGPTAHATYTTDYTTTDTATGLVWKTCSQGLSGATCATGSAVTLTWANASADATNGCTALNSANSGNGYAGIKTWRLPTRQELETLPDHSTSNPAINTTAFPATVANNYWSSTSYVPDTTKALYVFFSNGVVEGFTKTNTYYVRCVSGRSKDDTFSFADNSDGTVKDNTTGLIWQKCSQGQTNDSTCSGGSTTATWADAITFCSGLGLAGKTWRLPHINELKTIVDTTKASGATIDTTAFPTTVAFAYWSSTTFLTNTSVAWYVNFLDGYVGYNLKSITYYVRCVSGP